MTISYISTVSRYPLFVSQQIDLCFFLGFISFFRSSEEIFFLLTIRLVWNANMLQHHKIRSLDYEYFLFTFYFYRFSFLANRSCIQHFSFFFFVCSICSGNVCCNSLLWLSICSLFVHILLMFSFGSFRGCISISIRACCPVMHEQQPKKMKKKKTIQFAFFETFLIFFFFHSVGKIHDPHTSIFSHIFSVCYPLWFRYDTCWLFIFSSVEHSLGLFFFARCLW